MGPLLFLRPDTAAPPAALKSYQTNACANFTNVYNGGCKPERDPSDDRAALKNWTGADAQPPRWRIPPSYQELLQAALQGGAAESFVTSEQRDVIRRICSTPERQTFEPEDFLIAFKLALVEAANAVKIPLGPERNEFLSRLVSVCIEEFYRLPQAGESAKNADGPERATPGF